MEAAAGDMVHLPEELLAEIISLTSPWDACRAAAVSRAFLAAADSDAVWSRFLPRDLPRSVDAAERSLMALPSYKARFFRLSDDPVLLKGVATRMWADKGTGFNTYTLSRVLKITLGDEQQRWRWILDTHCNYYRSLKSWETRLQNQDRIAAGVVAMLKAIFIATSAAPQPSSGY